jgi:3D (Asp-Asp-Asp) domain-containing protein
MDQWEKTVRVIGSRSSLFGVATWVALGVFLLLGVSCMKMANANEAVFLRTMMPSESIVQAAPAAVDDDLDADDDVAAEDIEQRLIEMLGAADPDVMPSVVQSDQRWRVVRMRVTAYCPCPKCCGNFSDGITASNHRIRPGDMFVAADKAFRFQTELVVPGYNSGQPVKVLDRGRLIKGNRLDVFFSSHSVAKKWGTRYLDVMVREK